MLSNNSKILQKIAPKKYEPYHPQPDHKYPSGSHSILCWCSPLAAREERSELAAPSQLARAGPGHAGGRRVPGLRGDDLRRRLEASRLHRARKCFQDFEREVLSPKRHNVNTKSTAGVPNLWRWFAHVRSVYEFITIPKDTEVSPFDRDPSSPRHVDYRIIQYIRYIKYAPSPCPAHLLDRNDRTNLGCKISFVFH